MSDAQIPQDETPDKHPIHKLIRNGLEIYGKIEHFTEEELRTFTRWIEERL